MTSKQLNDTIQILKPIYFIENCINEKEEMDNWVGNWSSS